MATDGEKPRRLFLALWPDDKIRKALRKKLDAWAIIQTLYKCWSRLVPIAPMVTVFITRFGKPPLRWICRLRPI